MKYNIKKYQLLLVALAHLFITTLECPPKKIPQQQKPVQQQPVIIEPKIQLQTNPHAIALPYPKDIADQLKDKNTKIDLDATCPISGGTFADLFKEAKTNTIVAAAALTNINNQLVPHYFNALSYRDYAQSQRGDQILNPDIFNYIYEPINRQQIVHSLFFTITYHEKDKSYTVKYLGDQNTIVKDDEAIAQLEGILLNNVDGGKAEKIQALNAIIQLYSMYGKQSIVNALKQVVIPPERGLSPEEIEKAKKEAEELKKAQEELAKQQKAIQLKQQEQEIIAQKREAVQDIIDRITQNIRLDQGGQVRDYWHFVRIDHSQYRNYIKNNIHTGVSKEALMDIVNALLDYNALELADQVLEDNITKIQNYRQDKQTIHDFIYAQIIELLQNRLESLSQPQKNKKEELIKAQEKHEFLQKLNNFRLNTIMYQAVQAFMRNPNKIPVNPQSLNNLAHALKSIKR